MCHFHEAGDPERITQRSTEMASNFYDKTPFNKALIPIFANCRFQTIYRCSPYKMAVSAKSCNEKNADFTSVGAAQAAMQARETRCAFRGLHRAYKNTTTHRFRKITTCCHGNVLAVRS